MAADANSKKEYVFFPLTTIILVVIVYFVSPGDITAWIEMAQDYSGLGIEHLIAFPVALCLSVYIVWYLLSKRAENLEEQARRNKLLDVERAALVRFYEDMVMLRDVQIAL